MTESQPQPQTAARPQAPPQPAVRSSAGGAYEPFDPRHKSPVLAGILSFMPGLGQIYVGYYQRGFAHALVVATLIAMLASNSLDELIPFTAIFLAFFWLYNVVDAGRRAAFYNRALAEGGSFEPIRLPADAFTPGPQGSLIGGTMLVAVGFVLLLHTRFGLSLEWIEDWWPAAPMVLGAYMVYMAIQERRHLAAAEGQGG